MVVTQVVFTFLIIFCNINTDPKDCNWDTRVDIPVSDIMLRNLSSNRDGTEMASEWDCTNHVTGSQASMASMARLQLGLGDIYPKAICRRVIVKKHL